MEPTLITLIALMVIFLAGLIQGLTGFGFSLVSVPILVVFFDIRLLIPAIILQSLALNIMLFYKARRWSRIRRIWPLMVGGVIGIPFGTCLLIIIDQQLLKLLIGILIIIFGLAYLKNFHVRVKSEKRACAPIGFASGVLNGSISMSGPPLIFFFTNQGVKKRTFRANLITYHVFINLVAIPFFFAGGLFSQDSIELSMIFLPAMIIGALIGGSLVRKTNERLFHNIALVLVIVAGAISLASGLGWI